MLSPALLTKYSTVEINVKSSDWKQKKNREKNSSRKQTIEWLCTSETALPERFVYIVAHGPTAFQDTSYCYCVLKPLGFFNCHLHRSSPETQNGELNWAKKWWEDYNDINVTKVEYSTVRRRTHYCFLVCFAEELTMVTWIDSQKNAL